MGELKGEEVSAENWPVGFYPPYHLYNQMENECLQIVYCDRNDLNVLQPVSTSFYAALPYNDEGTIMTKQLPQDLAPIVDWRVVGERVLQEWKDNGLSSKDVEKMGIVDLLVKLEIMRQTVNENVIIDGQPQVSYEVVDEYRWPHG